MGDGEPGAVSEPHGKGAIEAAPTLGVEGGISSGFVASRHMHIQDRARGVFSQRLFNRPMGTWAVSGICRLKRWRFIDQRGAGRQRPTLTTGGSTDQQWLYRARAGVLSR